MFLGSSLRIAARLFPGLSFLRATASDGLVRPLQPARSRALRPRAPNRVASAAAKADPAEQSVDGATDAPSPIHVEPATPSPKSGESPENCLHRRIDSHLPMLDDHSFVGGQHDRASCSAGWWRAHRSRRFRLCRPGVFPRRASPRFDNPAAGFQGKDGERRRRGR